ncbi:hypothetical protein [Dactylosporangium salmoneum]|uniref:Uncharacterized protein n=1 Tax=Dactylosporangium salmoneum TaxID=53361 RepID=A0ABN3GEI5_9ACTN
MTGEHDEWRAWLDVYGVIVEQHAAAGCWTTRDALFDRCGRRCVLDKAAALLADAIAAPLTAA